MTNWAWIEQERRSRHAMTGSIHRIDIIGNEKGHKLRLISGKHPLRQRSCSGIRDRERRTALAVMQSIGTRRHNHARTILAVTVSSAAAILAAALIPAMTEERHPSGTGQEIRLSSGPAGQTRPDEPRLYTAYKNSRALRKFIEQNSNGK